MTKHNGVNYLFWNEKFWLSNNLTWKDLENTSRRNFGQAGDLLWAVPLALLLFIVRLLFERFIAKRIGLKLNISDAPHKSPSENKILEKVYATITKKPDQERLEGLCKQLDWNERQVQRWFRRRSKIERPTTLKKFCEGAWRFFFYLSSSICGLLIVYKEEFLWETRRFFTNHPRDHQLKMSHYWYYMLELSFYCALCFSQFFDIRRKDFLEMFIHHIATIMLISVSYIANFTKIGVAIMLTHDFSDVFLEFAKLAKYAKRKKLTSFGFILLSITFIATRLIIFPFGIISSVWYEGMVILKPFSIALQILFCALLLLQVLHLYWFTHLLGVAYSTIFLGENERDSRSDSEGSTAEEES